MVYIIHILINFYYILFQDISHSRKGAFNFCTHYFFQPRFIHTCQVYGRTKAHGSNGNGLTFLTGMAIYKIFSKYVSFWDIIDIDCLIFISLCIFIILLLIISLPCYWPRVGKSSAGRHLSPFTGTPSFSRLTLTLGWLPWSLIPTKASPPEKAVISLSYLLHRYIYW